MKKLSALKHRNLTKPNPGNNTILNTKSFAEIPNINKKLKFKQNCLEKQKLKEENWKMNQILKSLGDENKKLKVKIISSMNESHLSTTFQIGETNIARKLQQKIIQLSLEHEKYDKENLEIKNKIQKAQNKTVNLNLLNTLDHKNPINNNEHIKSLKENNLELKNSLKNFKEIFETLQKNPKVNKLTISNELNIKIRPSKYTKSSKLL